MNTNKRYEVANMRGNLHKSSVKSKENSPDMCVHWLDDLTTWEREENLIVISGVEIIGKKKS